MTDIGAFGARKHFGALLDRAARGEEIVISRHGKPLARLVAVAPSGNPERNREAAAALRALAREMEEPAPNRGGLTLFPGEGRR